MGIVRSSSFSFGCSGSDVLSFFFSDTAYIQSRDKWMYCDDSSVKEGDPAQVVVRFSPLPSCVTNGSNLVFVL